MWFFGVEVKQETSAPPSKKNPGSAPALSDALNDYETKYFWKQLYVKYVQSGISILVEI